MKQTDINRIRYEVERQIILAIDRELDELNKIFARRANNIHRILFSDEALNIIDHTYGPRFQRLDEIRSRLEMKETENWKASGEVLKKQLENRRRLTELTIEREEEE